MLTTLIFSLLYLIGDRCLSRKSVQSSEKTEDGYENSDDGIGTVLQVCGLLALFLYSLSVFLFSCPFQDMEVKGVSCRNKLENFSPFCFNVRWYLCNMYSMSSL